MSEGGQHLSAQVLIVDDEPDDAEAMGEALRRLGHVCTLVHDLPSAVDELGHGAFDVVVTDLVMDSEDAGMKVLAEARKSQPHAEVIMVTAHGDVPSAKAAIRGGAYEFIEKPLDLDVFRNLVKRAAETVLLRYENDHLRQPVDQSVAKDIIGASPTIQQVLARVRQIAPTDSPVLITGESGTGKELVARAIHANSPRAHKRFKPVNCAGLSASILESELFGHVKGAFTGAERDREGVFEYANGGTLLLDEIGDMPMDMQAKLLRVLESGEVVRVGDNEPRHVDVRLISATSHDLGKLLDAGHFRENLLYYIRSVEIHLPPLRQRLEDIPLLTRHFVQRFAEEMDRRPPHISEQAQAALRQRHWPGNVRELISTVRNMVATCDGPTIESRHVPVEVRRDAGAETDRADAGSLAGMSLDQIEKQAIRNTLRLTGGNREQAAKLLDIGERTLYRKLREYGLK